MEYTWLIDLIGTVGFPMACVIVMGWFIFKIYKKSEQREDALRSQIVESQKVNAEAIHAITLCAERIGVMESDIKEIREDVKSLKE